MAIVSADLKEYKSNATLSDGQDISVTEVGLQRVNFEKNALLKGVV